MLMVVNICGPDNDPEQYCADLADDSAGDSGGESEGTG